MRQGQLQLLNTDCQVFNPVPVEDSEFVHVVQVKPGVCKDALAQLPELMPMMEEFDSLLQANGDEQAEDDGGDMDKEVAPCAGRVVGWMDVEHGCGLLGRAGRFRRWDVVRGFRSRDGWRLWRGWRLIWRAIGHSQPE
jgi:hypothetical protein